MAQLFCLIYPNLWDLDYVLLLLRYYILDQMFSLAIMIVLLSLHQFAYSFYVQLNFNDAFLKDSKKKPQKANDFQLIFHLIFMVLNFYQSLLRVSQEHFQTQTPFFCNSCIYQTPILFQLLPFIRFQMLTKFRSFIVLPNLYNFIFYPCIFQAHQEKESIISLTFLDFADDSSCATTVNNLSHIINHLMNSQQRSQALSKFIDYIDNNHIRTSHKVEEGLADIDLDEKNLPKLDNIGQLMTYHADITGTIGKTFRQVSDIMVHMKELKNRKKNVQKIIDCTTAIFQIKKISYGLGNDPKEIFSNLQTYYSIKSKVFYVDKFIDRIQTQIAEVEKQYQATFDNQMRKNNSSNIAELSKVLQIIRKHSHTEAKPDTLQQIIDYCLSNVNKEFKKIEEDLFAIPIVGTTQSNYQFFDMAKAAMKIIVSLSNNSKVNVIKVSGQDGYVAVLKKLFEASAGGLILQLLMRLKKFYEIDKIALHQTRFALKEKDIKRLQPYFKEFVAIWNQLQRLRIHLQNSVSEDCLRKKELQIHFQQIISSVNFVEISANSIQFMQAIMRYHFDKLLKNSVFVTAVCTTDSDFFKEVNQKNIAHNPQAQDFLEETINKISQGIGKALQTLNTLIISATINFANHNLIFQDVFYAFNQLFTRTFSKLPSNDPKCLFAVILVLNTIHAFPKALTTLLSINLPEQIPNQRIKGQLQQLVNNNEQKALKQLERFISQIVSVEWFRHQLIKGYEKIPQKWIGLEGQCFILFVQHISKIHAQIIRQTQFSKKYTQTAAISFENDVRKIISHYQQYSHSIYPNFATIMDFVQILRLEDQDDFRRVAVRLSSNSGYSDDEMRKIWSLKI